MGERVVFIGVGVDLLCKITMFIHLTNARNVVDAIGHLVIHTNGMPTK
jgi:hypothetical protein